MDTAAVVAAMRSPSGASAAIIRAVRGNLVTQVLNVPLVMEYEAVCQRIEHRTAAGLSAREVDAFLNAIVAIGEPVDTHFLWRPQLHDPNDEMVLETAVNGHADILVTFNLRNFGTAAAQFGIQVLLPREAIARIKQ
jgi:putative PIN family toxin of toxin-antitoxin system